MKKVLVAVALAAANAAIFLEIFQSSRWWEYTLWGFMAVIFTGVISPGFAFRNALSGSLGPLLFVYIAGAMPDAFWKALEAFLCVVYLLGLYAFCSQAYQSLFFRFPMGGTLFAIWLFALTVYGIVGFGIITRDIDRLLRRRSAA